ncbi:hypothetical protein ABBQ38_013609 [Trebouxia sp. C0009 RCD-2024]
MRFDALLAHGLRVIIDIDQQPGNNSALTVSADVSMSGQFLTQRLSTPRGASRIFAGRLVEGVDLLEEDLQEVSRETSHCCDNMYLCQEAECMQDEAAPSSTLIQSQAALGPVHMNTRARQSQLQTLQSQALQAQAQAQALQPQALHPSAQPDPLAGVNRCQQLKGYYKRKEDIPTPPIAKPWLRHGGTFHVSDDRYFNVCAKAVTCKRIGSASDNGRYYILTFVAHKFVACKTKPITKTFAATLLTQSEREHRAMRWLHSDTEVGRDDSENDSTIARIN